MPLGLFIFLAAIAVLSALGVILQRNPVHCLLALVLTLLDMAVMFIGLGAVTVGFLQAIVYVGAIMVLFLFVIWLLNLQAEDRGGSRQLALKFFGVVGAAVLIAELFVFLVKAPSPAGMNHPPPLFGSIASLAGALFTNYLIAFEATSLLLLVAVIGAVALARHPAAAGSLSPAQGAQPVASGGSEARPVTPEHKAGGMG
ncbi:MAG: NADH-quinone oxidoreductase subunit J [Candidatus Binataceae bacterium]|nr:NADH-quinone oxidoreductase subunit J [Candidatus Binataceae bacterium]